MVGGLALQQLCCSGCAPLLGGAAGGVLYRTLFVTVPAKPDMTGEPDRP